MSKFKYFMMAIVIIPCALLFTACFGNDGNGAGQFEKVNLDVDGNYVQSDLASVSDVVENGNVGIEEGYRITYNYEISGDQSMGIAAQKMDFTMIFKKSSNASDVEAGEMALKMTGKNSGVSAEMEMFARVEDSVDKCYVKSTQNGKTEKLVYTGSNPVAYIVELVNTVNQYLPTVEDLSTLKGIEVATSGDTTKIKFKLSETSSNSLLYYVYKNNEFKGMKIENAEVAMGAVTAKINATMVPFAGDIEYPNFSDYKPAQSN